MLLPTTYKPYLIKMKYISRAARQLGIDQCSEIADEKYIKYSVKITIPWTDKLSNYAEYVDLAKRTEPVITVNVDDLVDEDIEYPLDKPIKLDPVSYMNCIELAESIKATIVIILCGTNDVGIDFRIFSNAIDDLYRTRKQDRVIFTFTVYASP